MLTTSKLALISPRSWHDPYEEWWCEKLFRSGSKLETARAFGLCWSMTYDSEPFWRLYGNSDAAPIVRIRSTVGKLTALLAEVVNTQPGKAFVGQVHYKEAPELRRAANELLKGDVPEVATTAAKLLCMKRAGYSFENEVRMLLIDRNGDGKLREVDLKPLDLIDDVRIGPTKQPMQADVVRAVLLRLGLRDRAVVAFPPYSPSPWRPPDLVEPECRESTVGRIGQDSGNGHA
jgi:hypothetical protein